MFENYLSSRIQYTCASNNQSTTSKLRYGVPRGSNQGPLLFLLYVNDLPITTKIGTTPFAETILIYHMLAIETRHKGAGQKGEDIRAQGHKGAGT